MRKRVAIVSGAGGDLGAAIARRLADDGFAVAGCDLVVGGAGELHVELDVVDRAAVGAFVERVAAESGRPRSSSPRRASSGPARARRSAPATGSR